MRHLLNALCVGALLLAGGTGCLPKAIERVVVEVERLEAQVAAEQPLHIKLDPSPGFRIDDGRPKRLGALKTDLEGRRGEISQSNRDPVETAIRISVDDAVRYEDFAKLVEVCRECGFVKFEVAIAEHVFSVDLSPRGPSARDDMQLPPMKVRLQADDDGQLAGLQLNDRELRDFSNLQIELIAILGDDHGPGSLQDMAEVELICDGNLKFRHLAAAYLAASGYETDDGGRVTLVKTIWPVTGWRTHGPEETEMVEEFPLEPIEVEVFETIPIEQPAEILEPTLLGEPTDDAPINVDISEVEPAPEEAKSPNPPDRDCAEDEPDDPAPDNPAPGKSAPGESDPEESAPAKLDSAVVVALKWLAEHQMPNGSWSFEHQRSACRGRCDGAGSASDAANAATAIVVLPFLAAGQTHQRGEHREAVGKGVDFLLSNAKPKPEGTSFHERSGNMYSHGLATMALCEAYRQTEDEKLKPVCQQALDFIVSAQDPVGGGWRYLPRQPGDTSVGGWQVSALRAGQRAGLTVPTKTLKGASRFLDSVQADGGLTYGYTTPGAGRATTAIGLLSRLHLGGKRNDEVWRRGVTWLEARGPSTTDMYYNFYATQTLAQHGGEPWKKWNASIRGMLRASQAAEGHATGSWYLGEGHAAARGGRILDTSLATLILAIPDRHLGIFQVETPDE